MPVRWGEGVGLGRWGWDGSRQDSGDAVQYCLLPLVYDFPDCSGPSMGGTQGAKKRDGDSKPSYDAEVTPDGCGTPGAGDVLVGPRSQPCLDKGVGWGAMGEVAMHTEVVPVAAVGAGDRRDVVVPVGSIVAISQSCL